jgi:hypothetical protein
MRREITALRPGPFSARPGTGATVAIGVGSLLLTSIVWLMLATTPEAPGPASVPAAERAAAAPERAPRSDAVRAPHPTEAPVPPQVPSAPPQLLRIGALDVTAPLVQVGLLPDGGMEVPDDVDVVGWYAVEGRTISPGDPGTAVLAGHRDSRRTGPGALHALGEVGPGDVIGVLHDDGTFSEWRVTEVMTTPRDALPTAELFTASGVPRLAVVTCGGRFNLLTRSYSHNTIVIAHRLE